VLGPVGLFDSTGGIVTPGLTATDGAIPGGGQAYSTAVVERNIDKYYNIFVGATGNYARTVPGSDSYGAYGMGATANRATEIRFKRINSEYVLVDFNITVNVENPILPGGTATTTDGDNFPILPSQWIDNLSPRMTQYMSFVYSTDSARNDFTEAQYGNGPWFSNWSTFNHWIAGSAVSSGGTDDPDIPGTLGAVNSPRWNVNTWNGNFIDAVSTLNQVDGFAPGWNVSNILGFAGLDDELGNPIRPRFSAAPINMTMSSSMRPPNSQEYPTNGFEVIGRSFMGLRKYFYSAFGNAAFSRVRPMMWRMMPYRYAPSFSAPPTTTNNTFLLEIMFDTPIMHTAHNLNPNMYGSTYPYKFLTVTGQSILRYAKSNKTP
jgi:hypothetical protein